MLQTLGLVAVAAHFVIHNERYQLYCYITTPFAGERKYKLSINVVRLHKICCLNSEASLRVARQ
jgi:hypothetical protein